MMKKLELPHLRSLKLLCSLPLIELSHGSNNNCVYFANSIGNICNSRLPKNISLCSTANAKSGHSSNAIKWIMAFDQTYNT